MFPKNIDRGAGGSVGGVSSINLFCDFWNFFNFAKSCLILKDIIIIIYIVCSA